MHDAAHKEPHRAFCLQLGSGFSFRECLLTLLLAVSLLIRARFDSIVFVDLFEQSVVDRLLGVGELEPILAHLSEHRRLAQRVNENSVRRNATFSESLLKLVLSERTAVEGYAEDIDGFDVVFCHECVISHVSLCWG